MSRLLIATCTVWTCISTGWIAAEKAAAQTVPSESSKPQETEEQFKSAIAPLFDQIVKAKSTRATVELSAETVVDGAVVGKEESVYQIASALPDQFTIYLKSAAERVRVYCDGKSATVAFSPTEYAQLDSSLTMRQAVYQLPIAMGPYPEIVLALTLAGNDPGFTLTSGMKSLELVDRGKFRGETPAIHLRGVQDDDVRWDLWITQDKKPRPLRLQVDLTEMLRANGQLELPETYRYVLRFDFKYWLIDHKNEPGLFRFDPPPEATRFDSVEAYANRKRQ